MLKGQWGGLGVKASVWRPSQGMVESSGQETMGVWSSGEQETERSGQTWFSFGDRVIRTVDESDMEAGEGGVMCDSQVWL